MALAYCVELRKSIKCMCVHKYELLYYYCLIATTAVHCFFFKLLVFRQDDVGTHWYAVVSGSLDVCLVDPDCPEKVCSVIYKSCVCMWDCGTRYVISILLIPEY